MPQEINIYTSTTPREFVRQKLTEGYTPFGLLTGSLGKAIDISLIKLERGEITLESVKKLIRFEGQVMRILIPDFNLVQLEDLLNAYSSTPEDERRIERMISGNKLTGENVLKYISDRRRKKFKALKSDIPFANEFAQDIPI